MTCSCCPAKAKFDLHGIGYACGRHLAYMIRYGQMGEQEVLVTIIEKQSDKEEHR